MSILEGKGFRRVGAWLSCFLTYVLPLSGKEETGTGADDDEDEKGGQAD